MLRKERKSVDAAKAARIAHHRARSAKTASATKTVPLVETSGGDREGAGTPEAVDRVIEEEVEDLWEEMEALEVGGDSGSEEDGEVVGDMIRVEKRH